MASIYDQAQTNKDKSPGQGPASTREDSENLSPESLPESQYRFDKKSAEDRRL